MTPAIAAVAFYTGLNALIFLALTANCGRARGAARVSIGDGGDTGLIRAMRGQANWVENTPITLMMLYLLAVLAAPLWAVHGLGIMLTLGRGLHAVHFIQSDAPGWQRAAGAMFSLLSTTLCALGLVGYGLIRMAA